MANRQGPLYPNVQQVENGVQFHEEIPLNRLDSQEQQLANMERQRIRTIFDTYDLNRDGYLSLAEIKELIKAKECPQIPKGLANRILKVSDQNNDGRLDFDEFYEMSQIHDYLFRDYCVKYCKFIVPRRTPVAAGDETDGQYENSMVFCPPPLTMIIFSIVEVIFFVIDIVKLHDNYRGIEQVGTQTNGPMATLFIYNPRLREEAWRFMTYMFVHIGIMHIMMNLLVQIFLGVALELVHSWWRVALVYLSGVLAGSMGTSICSPRIYLAGASGGVYALITAHIATIIMNWSEMEYAIVQLFVFLVFCGTDLSVSVYNHLYDKNDRVGYTAHLCGALAGLLVGIGVLRNLKVRPWEKKLWWVAITIYISLMTAGILFHIFNSSHFLPSGSKYV